MFSSILTQFEERQHRHFVVPSVDHKIRKFAAECGNFPNRKKSAAELCKIIRMVTIEIVINSTTVDEMTLYAAGMQCPR